MNDLLSSLDWSAVLQTLWTVIIVPLALWIKSQIQSYVKTKKISKYTEMLYTAIENVVKDVQVSIVDDIKGTDEWTEEKIAEIRQIAIDKAIASMTSEGYQLLTEANSDFENWIDSVIRAKLYDLKQSTKATSTNE